MVTGVGLGREAISHSSVTGDDPAQGDLASHCTHGDGATPVIRGNSLKMQVLPFPHILLTLHQTRVPRALGVSVSLSGSTQSSCSQPRMYWDRPRLPSSPAPRPAG
jgi:hypothetical protein